MQFSPHMNRSHLRGAMVRLAKSSAGTAGGYRGPPILHVPHVRYEMPPLLLPLRPLMQPWWVLLALVLSPDALAAPKPERKARIVAVTNDGSTVRVTVTWNSQQFDSERHTAAAPDASLPQYVYGSMLKPSLALPACRCARLPSHCPPLASCAWANHPPGRRGHSCVRDKGALGCEQVLGDSRCQQGSTLTESLHPAPPACSGSSKSRHLTTRQVPRTPSWHASGTPRHGKRWGLRVIRPWSTSCPPSEALKLAVRLPPLLLPCCPGSQRHIPYLVLQRARSS